MKKSKEIFEAVITERQPGSIVDGIETLLTMNKRDGKRAAIGFMNAFDALSVKLGDEGETMRADFLQQIKKIN